MIDTRSRKMKVKLFFVGILVSAMVFSSLIAVAAQSAPPLLLADVSVQDHIGGAMFVQNVGQFDPRVRFYVPSQNGAIWLTEDSLWLTILEAPEPKANHPEDAAPVQETEDLESRQGVAIRLSFAGANPSPEITPIGRLETSVNYLIGNNPAEFRTDVPVWSGVRYVDLYPGIDLELGGENGRLVPRLVARQGADLSAVRLQVEGADSVELLSPRRVVRGKGSILSISEGSGIKVATNLGEFTLPLLALESGYGASPVVVQSNSQAFEIANPFMAAGGQSLAIGETSTSDLLYSTILSGSESTGDVAVDSSGNVYITGNAFSTFKATPGSFSPGNNGNQDAFVAKLNSAGMMVYATFLGGDRFDYGFGIAVDSSGNAYVTGMTSSPNFPVTFGAFDTSHNSPNFDTHDAYVAKLNPAGNSLIYSTFLGGRSVDRANAIALDGSGNAYITGTTYSPDFPVTSGAFDTSFDGDENSFVGDGFVAKLNPAGSALVYATFLGGYTYDSLFDIAVDGGGNAYITGTTSSPDFPVTVMAFDRTYNDMQDAVVAKLNPTGSALVYSTFLGGSAYDRGSGIAVDGSGNAFVTGETLSSNFPVTLGAFDTSHNDNMTIFVAKFNSNGSNLAYSTFLGGQRITNYGNYANSIAVDGSGSVYVSGATLNPDFPVTSGAFDTTHNGNYDGFFAKLNPAGSELVYSTFLGGGNSDSATGIALDGSGGIYLAGRTSSSDFPATTVYGNYSFGSYVAKFAIGGGGLGPTLTPTATSQFTSTPTPTSRLTATPTSRLTATPTTTPPTPTPTFLPWNPFPSVTGIEGCFQGSFYPKGLSFKNRYRAKVDWKNDWPNIVKFQLNSDDEMMGTPYPKSTDFYHDQTEKGLKYGTLYELNTLKAVAINGSNLPSKPYELSIIGINAPSWGGTLPFTIPVKIKPGVAPECLDQWGAVLRFQWEKKIPQKPFDFKVKPPEMFPFIGGKEFSLKDSQGKLVLEGGTDGNGKADVSGQGTFTIADQQATGKIFGKGDFNVDPKQLQFQIPEASFGFDVGMSFSKEWGLASLVPALEAAENWPVIGNAIKWLNKKAKIIGQLSPSVNIAFNFELKPMESFKFKEFNAGGGLKGLITLALGVMKELTAEAFGGLDGLLQFQFPPQPEFLKEIAVKVLGGVKAKAFGFEYDFQSSHEWKFTPGTQNSQAVLSQSSSGEVITQTVSTGGWRPILRNYAVRPEGYAIFRANERNLLLSTGTVGTEERPIVLNVFPESHPDLAAQGGNPILVWVHDDTSKDLMQGKEIYYTVYDNSTSTWRDQAGITNDTLLDFAPQVAYDENGNAVAVWLRNKNEQSLATQFNQAYTNDFEIAYAVWDGNSWGETAYLTNNQYFDHGAVLARGNDGQLVLVWRQNRDGELLGSSDHPDTFYWAVWNGSAWSAPQVLLDNVYDIMELDVARYDENNMIVVYSADTDGDFSTNEDLRLHFLSWDGSAWTGPTPLLDEGGRDSNPTVMYDAVGNPRFLWLREGTLYTLLDEFGGEFPVVGVINDDDDVWPLYESTAVLDYEAAQDDAGNMIFVWQEYSEAGLDVFYSVYHREFTSFSRPKQLTNDGPAEKFMALDFAQSGVLLMAYGKDQWSTTTVTINDLDIPNVAQFERSDLYVLRHTFAPDLAVTASDIQTDPANPAPGTTAQVLITLHNLGDLTVENPRLAVYLGDPASGGTLIDEANVPITLEGGMTTTVQIDWDFPPLGGPFALYAVADPDGAVTEWDEENNQAWQYTSLPDPAVEDVRVKYDAANQVILRAIISNSGVTRATNIPVDFWLDDPVNGQFIGGVLLNSLEPGEEVIAQFDWDASSVETGWHKVYAVVNPNATLAEADEENNAGWIGVGILPDLALRHTDLLSTTGPWGTTVKVRVFNLGAGDAQNVLVGLYDREPLLGSEPLAGQRVNIPAYGYQDVTLSTPSPLLRFYVGVNMNREIEERDIIGNNLLTVGEIYQLYLPLILFNR